MCDSGSHFLLTAGGKSVRCFLLDHLSPTIHILSSQNTASHKFPSLCLNSRIDLTSTTLSCSLFRPITTRTANDLTLNPLVTRFRTLVSSSLLAFRSPYLEWGRTVAAHLVHEPLIHAQVQRKIPFCRSLINLIQTPLDSFTVCLLLCWYGQQSWDRFSYPLAILLTRIWYRSGLKTDPRGTPRCSCPLSDRGLNSRPKRTTLPTLRRPVVLLRFHTESLLFLAKESGFSTVQIADF